MTKNKREPLIHITKRVNIPIWFPLVVHAAALLLALLACAVLTLVMTGENPLSLLNSIINGSFGSSRKIWVMLQNTAMLLCVSLAVTPAFRMRFWNIGAEGQTLIACLASAACMILLRDVLPNWAIIVCMAAASWVVFPPGAAHRSSTHSPGCGSSAAAGAMALGSCR